jgi:formylglycine-generating enzyme required for sulfatase activity
MRVYCLSHRENFSVPMTTPILCERGKHSLGSAPNAPDGSDLWEYCCECQSFWLAPTSGTASFKCPACDRDVAARYLCDACQTLTLHSNNASSVREFFISTQGTPQPYCPGCSRTQIRTVVTHKCSSYGASFTSVRPNCPFCHTEIAKSAKQNPSPANDPASPSPQPPFRTGSRSGFGLKHVIALSVALLLLIPVLILFAVVAWQYSSSNTNTPKTTSTTNTPPGMVYVPGGVFIMGDDAGDEYEGPAHSATIKPFFIDINEVSRAKYAEFLRSTHRASPAGWSGANFPAGTGNQPVTGVNWYDAQAYAEWAGKRLPTEPEWEFAARGTDGRRYTWGDAWRSRAANAGDNSAGHLVDVGLYPEGKSPFGALDMIGNALEWTASDLRPYPDAKIANFPSGPRKILRGGSWAKGDPPDWTTTFRGFALPSGGSDYSLVGFRCAKDAPASSGIVEKGK